MTPLYIDLPEEIHTQNLTLQMPKAGFGAKLHEAILDGYEDYVKWLAWPETPPTAHDVEGDCRQHHAEFILRDFIRYIIVEKSSGDIVGRCAYPSFQVRWEIPQFGISYFTRKSARGKGYASEATHALAHLAFDLLKAKKIEICCDVRNEPSKAIPQKIGFELEYTQKGGWLSQDGELATFQNYALFSRDKLPNWNVSWDIHDNT